MVLIVTNKKILPTRRYQST